MDLEGPMLWPRWWKVVILLNLSFFAFMGNFYAAGVTPLFQYIMRDLKCTVEQASWLASYTVLTLGLANLATDLIIHHVGVRHAVLSTMALFMGTIVWSACARSYSSLMASRLLGGLAGGVIEALGPLIVTQIFPVEELGRALVVYMAFLAAGSTVGPVISGFIASGTGSWRWCFGVMAIVAGLNLLGVILMLPETLNHGDVPPAPVPVEEGDKLSSSLEIEMAPVPQGQATVSAREIWLRRSFFLRFQNPQETPTWYTLLLRPFKLLMVPPVLLCVLLYGWSVGCGTVASIVFSAVYAGPPYLWGPQNIGLISLASLVALTIGSPIGGNLADFLIVRSSRRTGEHRPESRLLLIGLSAAIAPTGLIIVGVALKHQLSWVAVAFGLGMLSFAVATACNILLSYCVDCYPTHSAQIGILVNVLKNVLGTVLSFFAVDWYAEQGSMSLFGTIASVFWFFHLCVIPLYLWGPRIRQRFEAFTL